MSTESFDLVSLGFEFHSRDSDAAQKVFDALNSHGLIGYLGAPQASDQLTYVPVDVATNKESSLLTATETGEVAKHEQSIQELAEELLEAAGAQALSLDGIVVAGTEVEFTGDDDAAETNSGKQVVAGTHLMPSELVMSSLGYPGVWKVRQTEDKILAVREGEPVEIRLGQKLLRAIELKSSEGYIQLSVHATAKSFQFQDSNVLEYWLPTEDRPVPMAATGSEVAQLQAKLGAQLYAADSEELLELERFWPEAAVGIVRLAKLRSLDGLRLFLKGLGLPEEMVDYLRGEPLAVEFTELPRSLPAGLDLAFEEEMAKAKGVMKLVYRTGWSPAALMSSSIAVIGAGALLNRWMKTSGKPGTGWRRTIMFFWYSDAGYYLARGIRQVLKAQLKNR
ncbi:hypothetical protein [Arthrobacter sp. MYb213]|uniref:hypothetical protein n=1 Tax=Arthrobacter sp. MYb213 TaxID=1848595 RepID=UPI000CFAA92A|nr:hypothetical protein [Arthrobacter sp. MYb213]PRB72623.1 hypothetical protein CQ011_03005 [Arthrobacter sp. MYb213]